MLLNHHLESTHKAIHKYFECLKLQIRWKYENRVKMHAELVILV